MFQVQDTDSAEVREAKLKCQASFQAMKDKQKEHEEAVKVAVSKQDDVKRQEVEVRKKQEHKEQAVQKVGVLEKQRAQLLAEVDGLKKRISALEEQQRAKMAEAETAKSLALQFNKEHAEAAGARDAAQKAVDSESAKVQQIEQAAVKSQQQLEKCMTLLNLHLRYHESLQKLNSELQSL